MKLRVREKKKKENLYLDIKNYEMGIICKIINDNIIIFVNRLVLIIFRENNLSLKNLFLRGIIIKC